MNTQKEHEPNQHEKSAHTVEDAQTWWMLSDNLNVRERLDIFSNLLAPLTDSELDKVFSTVPKWVLTKMASEPLTPQNVLIFLSKHPNDDVQWRVAINRSTPLDTLEKLVHSPSTMVRSVAERHYLMRQAQENPASLNF